MENVLDAYEYTLGVLDRIEKDLGYEVNAKPSKGASNPELVEKYNRDDRIPAEMWIHVEMTIDEEHPIDKLFEIQKELLDLGIGFDTGAGCSCEGGAFVRDWELDWSFNLDMIEPDGQ